MPFPTQTAGQSCWTDVTKIHHVFSFHSTLEYGGKQGGEWGSLTYEAQDMPLARLNLAQPEGIRRPTLWNYRLNRYTRIIIVWWAPKWLPSVLDYLKAKNNIDHSPLPVVKTMYVSNPRCSSFCWYSQYLSHILPQEPANVKLILTGIRIFLFKERRTF